jgi:hypothetical protein
MASGDVTSYSDVAVRAATGSATADSATFTTTETVLLTATGTVVSGQTYKVSVAANISSTVALDALICRIREDTVTGNQIDGKILGAVTNGISGYPSLLYAEWVASSTGSKTFVMTAARSTGSGTYQLRATSQRVSFLIVDRLVQ